jgi:hypothetical protein
VCLLTVGVNLRAFAVSTDIFSFSHPTVSVL